MNEGTDFDRQPYLGGHDIQLRPLVAADRAALFAAASDPLIWADHPQPDRWRRPVFDGFFAAALQSGGALAVIATRSNTIIGTSRFDRERAGPGEIEIGWSFLTRAWWGGRTNAVVKGLMLAHAFTHYERVLFFVGETNGRSRRAMEKIGGVLTDRQPVARLGSQDVRHVVFAIDRASWAGPRPMPDSPFMGDRCGRAQARLARR